MRKERQGTLCQSLHNMFIIIFITKLIIVNGFVADEDPCRSQLWLNSPWLCHLYNGGIFSQSNNWQLVRNMPSCSSGCTTHHSKERYFMVGFQAFQGRRKKGLRGRGGVLFRKLIIRSGLVPSQQAVHA